ncbi:MAG TPA: DedA family protein [Gaiellaceae bacterium]|nr:DedA family protein [Gaiellaceae bacterium]
MLLGSLSGSITHAVGNHGIYAVFGLLVLAAVVPVASELVMLYAGALAGGAFAGVSVHVFGADVHSHVWGYVAVAIAGTLGNLVGAAIGWWIGALGGRAVVQRWGRFIHVSEAKLDRAERWFERYDDWAVPLGLATPLARSFVAIPAGIVRVSFRKFLVLALLGSAVFCFGLGAAGWALGTAYTHAHNALGYADYVIGAGIVLVVAYLLVRWARVSRRRVSDTAR